MAGGVPRAHRVRPRSPPAWSPSSASACLSLHALTGAAWSTPPPASSSPHSPSTKAAKPGQANPSKTKTTNPGRHQYIQSRDRRHHLMATPATPDHRPGHAQHHGGRSRMARVRRAGPDPGVPARPCGHVNSLALASSNSSLINSPSCTSCHSRRSSSAGLSTGAATAGGGGSRSAVRTASTVARNWAKSSPCWAPRKATASSARDRPPRY
jgi:hypothetical protein